MSARLPMAEVQYPLCGACHEETWHDGDDLRCDGCLLCFDSTTMEASYLDPNEKPCGAPCGNTWHQPNPINLGWGYECQPCALPAGHHDGDPKDYQHWHDCRPVRIGGDQ